ncbi:MAG: ATP synthase F1 subunit epsilon [Ignavibacteriales bacterium]|nr:ATP synthase F1 subunit epsilon [Ignavibacteriales bacterium]
MSDKTFKLEIVTPAKIIFSGDVISFSAPGVIGGFQILYNHAPMLAEIGIGEIKYQIPDGREQFFATSGGYVDVSNNRVTVLAETIENATEIDKVRAEAARDKNKIHLTGLKSEEKRIEIKNALERAQNRIRIAEKRK